MWYAKISSWSMSGATRARNKLTQYSNLRPRILRVRSTCSIDNQMHLFGDVCSTSSRSSNNFVSSRGKRCRTSYTTSNHRSDIGTFLNLNNDSNIKTNLYWSRWGHFCGGLGNLLMYASLTHTQSSFHLFDKAPSNSVSTLGQYGPFVRNKSTLLIYTKPVCNPYANAQWSHIWSRSLLLAVEALALVL